MDTKLSGKWVVLAIAASAGLVAVLCLGLIAGLLIAGVGGDGRQNAEHRLDVVDRIAFLGTDGNLYLTDRNGENVEHLAVSDEGTALNYPTWSPDGQRVAFIANRETNEGVESVLYTVSTVGDDSSELYVSAEYPAFYLYWSPDGRHLTFLTQEDVGLALRLAPADGSQEARILERGAPFYWSWSPDSQEMFMHIGGARRSSQEARLAILSGDPDSKPDVLDDLPTNFQAPGWSPDGSRLLFAGEDENGEQALFVRDRQSGTVERLVNVSGLVRFNWSPDGRWIAYQQIDDLRLAPLGDVFVKEMSEDGTQTGVQQVNRELAVAFFWSPDSQRLAILVPTLEEDEPSAGGGSLAAPVPQEPRVLLRWWLADMPDGETRPLATFRPTRSFLSIIPYFDQYAQSIRFWSPDSRYLLYSDQGTPEQAGIWIADVMGTTPPRRLVDGTLAVWSWQ